MGQTTQPDPIKYRGSGTDWKKHLREFGNFVRTEIIAECSSKEELGRLGRYYSKLLNILNAQDDFGNKIWANRIPETGGGGWNTFPRGPRSIETKNKIRKNKPDQSGENNGMFGKSHSAEARIKCGNANRGKDLKTDAGKKSISENMKNLWKNEDYRNNNVEMLRNRKGEKRSPEAIESYRVSARIRNAKISPEERARQTKKGIETFKLNHAGMKKIRIVDEFGKVSYIWIPATD